MANLAAHTHDSTASLPPLHPTAEDIQTQLRAILSSPSFHGSKRCQQFLEYVCVKALAGELGSLKERSIAVEVFGRQPQSDMGDDTIVRVGAREVRKRLAQFYVTSGGAAAPVVIELPLGSYLPEFRYVLVHMETVPVEAAAAPVVAPIPIFIKSDRSRFKLWAIAAAVVVVCASMIGWMYAASPATANKKAFNQFWAPVLQSNEPMLVAVGNPLVYHASWRAHILSDKRLPPQQIPLQRPIQVPPELLNGSDIIPVQNQYVGFGDLVATNEVSTMLMRREKEVRVRLASAVEFSDLRNTQTFLIGAITNRWTMELQNSWRFQFAKSGERSTVIADTQTPAGQSSPHQWAIPSKQDGSTAEDYFLVCRVKTPLAGGLQIVVAGLKQYGTEAAGRLVADPEQLGAILRTLPPGWENQNLQLVLHSRIIGNTPAQPNVIAWHVW